MDEPVSNFAFNFILRRYNEVVTFDDPSSSPGIAAVVGRLQRPVQVRPRAATSLWNGCGSVVERLWNGCGMVVERLWNGCGTVVERLCCMPVVHQYTFTSYSSSESF
jgi:hypothetical protein